MKLWDQKYPRTLFPPLGEEAGTIFLLFKLSSGQDSDPLKRGQDPQL